jgi:hypothetical protein
MQRGFGADDSGSYPPKNNILIFLKNLTNFHVFQMTFKIIYILSFCYFLFNLAPQQNRIHKQSFGCMVNFKIKLKNNRIFNFYPEETYVFTFLLHTLFYCVLSCYKNIFIFLSFLACNIASVRAGCCGARGLERWCIIIIHIDILLAHKTS